MLVDPEAMGPTLEAYATRVQGDHEDDGTSPAEPTARANAPQCLALEEGTQMPASCKAVGAALEADTSGAADGDDDARNGLNELQNAQSNRTHRLDPKSNRPPLVRFAASAVVSTRIAGRLLHQPSGTLSTRLRCYPHRFCGPNRLRRRPLRPTCPFALLGPDIDDARSLH